MLKTAVFLMATTVLPLAATAWADEAERASGVQVIRPESAPATGAATPARVLPRTAHQRAIAELQEQGRQKVRELTAAMKDVPDGPALLALQRKVEEIKRETRLALLRLHLAHALEKGDQALATEAQRQIDHLLHPPRPAVSAVSRPAPGAEGGSR